MRPPAPPLWIWGTSLALALALGAVSLPAFLAAIEARKRPLTWQDKAIRRFAKDAPTDGSALRVIAFGDSALASAVLPSEEMQREARERYGFELRFLRLTTPRSLLPRILSSLPAAIAARPDVVMIESWLIANPGTPQEEEVYRSFRADRPPGVVDGVQAVVEQPSLVLAHQAFVFNQLTAVLDTSPPEDASALESAPAERNARPHRRPRGALQCNEHGRRRLLVSNDRRWRGSAVESIDPLVQETLETLLQRGARAGVRVVFFEVPRAPQIEDLPGVRRKREVTRALLERYAAQGRAAFLPFPGALGGENTCDYVHMSERGRARYASWLLPELAALRGKGGAS